MSLPPPRRYSIGSNVVSERNQLTTAVAAYKKAVSETPELNTPDSMKPFLGGLAMIMSLNAKRVGKGYTANELRELANAIEIIPMRLVFLQIILDKTLEQKQLADQLVGHARLTSMESGKLENTLREMRIVRDEFTPAVIVDETPLTETAPKKKRRPKRTPQPKAE